MYFLLLSLVVLTGVSSQVCNKTVSVKREIPETYQYTYYEAYQGNDCLICPCTKSRLAVGVATRLVEKVINETVSVCCEGYVEDDTSTNDSVYCVPICDPPCQNGYCVKPNQCVCESGYAVDPHDVNRCLPLCLEGCEVSDCISACQYSFYPTEDMCYGNCVNGTCIAPGVCHCDPGYTRQSGFCEPMCSSCEHGTCVAPDVCKCNLGYHEECNACKPFCYGCVHGKCKSPGQCECNAGYKAINGRCEPYCANCNGKCLAPDTCACDPGWYLKDGYCVPHCSVPCGNGTCVAPDVCNCYSGYEILPLVNEAPLCKPVCIDCSFECVKPGVCKCVAPYETVHTTEDGRACDCFDCDDPNIKCVRVTCREVEINADKKGIYESVSAVTKRLEEITPLVHDATLNDKPISVAETKACPHLETAKSKYHWIQVAIITAEFLIIVLLLAVVLRKPVLNRLEANTFVPQEKFNSEVVVHYKTKTPEDS